MNIKDFILGYLIGKNDGGGGASVEPLTVTENGEYSEDGVAYSPVTVDVSNSYTQSDEGKVVSNGALVAQGSDTVTQNGTVDTTLINSLLVNVAGGGGASNIKTGTFTPPTTGAMSIDTEYTGNGYPIMCSIVLDGGLYDPDNTGWPPVNPYAVAEFHISKAVFDSVPDYSGSDASKCNVLLQYYTGSNFSRGGSYGAALTLANTDASGANNYNIVKFKNARTMSCWVADSNYAFRPNLTYRYCVVYSE